MILKSTADYTKPMKTKITFHAGRHYIEIPEAIVNLYSLKEGMIFRLVHKEGKKGMLMINVLGPIKNSK